MKEEIHIYNIVCTFYAVIEKLFHKNIFQIVTTQRKSIFKFTECNQSLECRIKFPTSFT